MNRRLLLVVLGIFLAGTAFYAGYTFHRSSYFLDSEQESSSVQALALLQRCQVILPEDVRALNVFSHDQGPDTRCWFTCKLSPEELETFLKHQEASSDSEIRRDALPAPRPRYDRPLYWWSPPENLEETSFGRLWTGYDRATGILYGYVFTI